TIIKGIRDTIRATRAAEPNEAEQKSAKMDYGKLRGKERENVIQNLEKEMKEAAKALDFEKAAELRDILLELKAEG
ncbi:MAG TPA: UvrB/UvrC motif-containing protein, partial [Candidatus Angelobacter sp.]|nr:UvrB/UvrC motif-containing protein [Candidatus Angelobacter sp.]